MVAAIRAMRISMAEMVDESNMFLSQIKKLAVAFSSCQGQVFNLLGYPMKAFHDRIPFISHLAEQADAVLFKTFPALRQHAVNCNIVLTK
jgi:hypothetical protein